MSFRHGSMLNSKLAMQFADMTQPKKYLLKMNRMVVAQNIFYTDREEEEELAGDLCAGACDPRTVITYTMASGGAHWYCWAEGGAHQPGRREVLGLLEAKEAAMLKMYKDHGRSHSSSRCIVS